MTFLLFRGNNQWAVKVSAFSGKCFWSYSNRQQENKMICTLPPVWQNKIYRCLFNQSYLLSAMGYGVGTCATLFTMNWGIHQGVVFSLN